MWNKKRVVLRMTVTSIGCTVKGTLFFLMLSHESIKYWTCELRLYILYIRYSLMTE